MGPPDAVGPRKKSGVSAPVCGPVYRTSSPSGPLSKKALSREESTSSVMGVVGDRFICRYHDTPVVC